MYRPTVLSLLLLDAIQIVRSISYSPTLPAHHLEILSSVFRIETNPIIIDQRFESLGSLASLSQTYSLDDSPRSFARSAICQLLNSLLARWLPSVTVFGGLLSVKVASRTNGHWTVMGN